MPATLPDATARIHPTVRLDFRVRVWVYPFYLALYGLHLWGRPPSAWVWAGLIAHMLVWPHIARFLASRSTNSKRAELGNLVLDAFVIGCYIPLTGYSLWPNAAGLLGIHAGNVSVGGPRFALLGVATAALGAVLMSFASSNVIDLTGASLATQLVSLVVVAAYTTVFSLQSYAQSRKVIRSNTRIRQQSNQIAEKGALLEQRSVEMEAAFDQAEAANRAKSDFLAHMSHELRTPLNSVIGFANILLRNSSKNLLPQDIAYLTRISANGSHLLTLINRVLDLSKIDAQEVQLDLTPVDLAVLITDTLSEMEPQAEARVVELVADIGPVGPLRADRARLKQILLNLVGNAVKFTQRGRVTVRVVTHPLTRQPTRIDVIDTGVGIAADRIDAVFEAFQQEHSTTSRQYGGTGLGLTITRSLVELMGWRMEVRSEPGVGSTFSVILAAGAFGPAESSSSPDVSVADENQVVDARG